MPDLGLQAFNARPRLKQGPEYTICPTDSKWSRNVLHQILPSSVSSPSYRNWTLYCTVHLQHCMFCIMRPGRHWVIKDSISAILRTWISDHWEADKEFLLSLIGWVHLQRPGLSQLGGTPCSLYSRAVQSRLGLCPQSTSTLQPSALKHYKDILDKGLVFGTSASH